jgi:hypothetical protein
MHHVVRAVLCRGRNGIVVSVFRVIEFLDKPTPLGVKTWQRVKEFTLNRYPTNSRDG